MKRRRIGIIYYGTVAFIMVFLLAAIIGIYGSLVGFRGPLWRTCEICGHIGLSLLIAVIVLYSATTKGTRYEGDSSDIVVNPVYKDYDINVFHQK
ncbi:MAG TPA: hypothetical protein VN328_10795 [Thermodesulfovibrionales bacterium]|nr:hypothetical protein [Thermodesulfovibrionales bacterium]